MLTYTSLDTVRQIARHASSLDAMGHHGDADVVDRNVLKAVQRLSANWMTNGYNAVSLGLHSGEPLYVLGTMRSQVNNLQTTVEAQRGAFTPSIQSLAEQLVQNVLAWLDSIQKDLFGAGGTLSGVGASPTSASTTQTATSRTNRRSRIVRLAGAAGTIESNARAALGVMQYLDRKELFPNGPEALRRITQDIQTLIALVLGEVGPESIANQMTINAQEGDAGGNGDGQDPMAAKAEGVRQYLGKGTDVSSANILGGNGQVAAAPVEDREAHIQRYINYMALYGYSAMLDHLRQYEGDIQFIALVKQRAQAVQNNGQQAAQYTGVTP